MYTTEKTIKGVLTAGMLLAVSGVATAADLPAVDDNLSIIVDKAVISGEIARGENGYIALDEEQKLMFDYSGDIHGVVTDNAGNVIGLSDNTIGSIQGQAAFPVEFAEMAIGVKAFMEGVAPMPAIPPVIEWTCNSCRMVVDGSTYVSIVDAEKASPEINAQYDSMFGALAGIHPYKNLDGSEIAVQTMRLWGRAFTGLGPSAMDPVNQTIAIRMAGCSAVVAVDGPNAGKMGTLCMNSTANFDLSGINLNDPFASLITAEGSSTCVTVLHTPLPMP